MGFGPYGNQISHLSKTGVRTANGWALGGGGPSGECVVDNGQNVLGVDGEAGAEEC